MKKLLNTLFITQPDSYLSLEGDNVIVLKKDKQLARIPLHHLESIVTFSHTGASPALMGYCTKRNISIVFLSPNGQLQGRLIGKSKWNVVVESLAPFLTQSPHQLNLIQLEYHPVSH